MSTPNVTWTNVAEVKPGQREYTEAGPREIVNAKRAATRGFVTVIYSDGTWQRYHRRDDLPILDEKG